MLFHEVTGAYFDTVSAILAEAADGTLDAQRLSDIVREKGFAESVLTIPRNLHDGTWPFLTNGYGTKLRHKPYLPMTRLQKQWLKALLLDPRIRLFDVGAAGLEDTEPLFTPDMFVYYDRYLDGDPFEDEGYITRFHMLREAIRDHRQAEVTFDSARGRHNVWRVMPLRLEYSSVDDKFRLIASLTHRRTISINLARVTDVCLLDKHFRNVEEDLGNETLVFELTDKRNALERAMLQFSFLNKETERLEDGRYRVTLYYRREDETELLIKLLSFGPVIRILSPEPMVMQAKERIQKQLRCGL